MSDQQRASVIGRRSVLAPVAQALRDRAYDVRRAVAARAVAGVDVVVVDAGAPKMDSRALLEALRAAPDLPVLVVAEPHEFGGAAVAHLAQRPATELVSSEAQREELGLRLDRLLPAAPGRHALGGMQVAALRSETSGRLDAIRISTFFRLSLSALARTLKRSVQSVHKTPDAPSLQPKLIVWERIAWLVQRVVGTDSASVRRWLETPSADLDGRTPAAVLLRRPSVVEELLRDALAGQPG